MYVVLLHSAVSGVYYVHLHAMEVDLSRLCLVCVALILINDFTSFAFASASRAAASFTSNSRTTWPFLTVCPSVARTFSTNVSSCARITYGEIGSTFPLLLMDETRFSRTGVTAEIFGTPFPPLNPPTTSATTPASAR